MSRHWVDILWHFLIKRHKIIIYIYYIYINHLFEFYCNSTDWLPHDMRSGCGDSWNRLQIVLHVLICVFMCLYTYVHVSVDIRYMYICFCVSVCIYMCVCVYVYMYIYVHMYIYMCVCIYTYIIIIIIIIIII